MLRPSNESAGFSYVCLCRIFFKFCFHLDLMLHTLLLFLSCCAELCSNLMVRMFLLFQRFFHLVALVHICFFLPLLHHGISCFDGITQSLVCAGKTASNCCISC